MRVNFRRGFFRIWIALAVLWIVPAVIINSNYLGLTSQPSNPTVTVNHTNDELFEARGPDSKTYRIESSDAGSARIAMDQLFGLLERGQVPPFTDAGGFYAWPTNGTRIWAVERPPRKPGLMKFKLTEPDGTVHFVEASSWEEVDPAVIEMRASGGQSAQDKQAGRGSEPVFFSPFVSPTNGARVWSMSSRFDDFPTAEEERAARYLAIGTAGGFEERPKRSARYRPPPAAGPARRWRIVGLDISGIFAKAVDVGLSRKATSQLVKSSHC